MTTNGENPVVQSQDLAIEQKLNSLATKRALADPMPGPLGEAFTSKTIEVGGKQVYKVVPRYFLALKAIKSPLIEMMQDIVSSGKVDTELKDEEAWEICWIFTHSPAEVREKLSKGVAALKEASQVEIGDAEDYPVNLVIIAVMEQLKRHLATAVKYTAEAQERGDVSFFQDLGTSQAPATAG